MSSAGPHLQRPKGPSGKRHRMVYAWLSADAFVVYAKAAEERELHRDVLVARVLEAAAKDGLVDAILDDRDANP